MGDIRLMRYVIAGKRVTFNKYCKDNNYKAGIDAIYCVSSTSTHGKAVREDDIIIFLPGWFARSWVKDFIKEIKILYPSIDFEYLDGQIGEKERNKLISENILSRFDILDL